MVAMVATWAGEGNCRLTVSVRLSRLAVKRCLLLPTPLPSFLIYTQYCRSSLVSFRRCTFISHIFVIPLTNRPTITSPAKWRPISDRPLNQPSDQRLDGVVQKPGLSHLRIFIQSYWKPVDEDRFFSSNFSVKEVTGILGHHAGCRFRHIV